ncbi:MAG: ABC transporter ATP-binding protein [Clostridia bacterium]|nr:ABC transporter ATP-binding protein [Clostridia bacterium]
MHLILHYLKPQFKRMSIGMVIKFFGSIMDLLLPYFLAHIIDNVIPLNNMGKVIIWGVLMLLCALLAWITNIIANRMAAQVAKKAIFEVRHDLFQKIFNLSNHQVDQATVPSLISRMTTDTYNLHRMIGMMQRIGLRAPILVLGGVLITLTLDPVLSGIMILMLPLMSLPVYKISKRSVGLFADLQERNDDLVRSVRENISGVRVIKALSKTEDEKKRFYTVNQSVYKAESKANRLMAVNSPMMNLILNLGLVLVILAGTWRVSIGATGVGTITAFLSYFTIILNAMMTVTRVLTMYSRALASAHRIQDILDLPEELQTGDYPDGNTDAVVCFEDVCFSYHKKQDNLSHISFALRKGESLGILGPTGSGKSTLASLLMRFYDPDQGRILLNGKDLRSMTPAEIRTSFGVVFQNDQLFRDTIGENIRIGRELTDEQLLQALEDAQGAKFVEEKGGLTAMIEPKASNLSGGQKQRLLIARALAGNPQILILDDSSSALDFKTDAALRKTLKERYADTTTILIAQRVSSVHHCDKILVLDDGVPQGLGTHEELLQSCALYREIYSLQTGEEVTA